MKLLEIVWRLRNFGKRYRVKRSETSRFRGVLLPVPPLSKIRPPRLKYIRRASEFKAGFQPKTSTFLSTIDSMLLGRTSSPPGIDEEIMAVRSLVSSLLRWTLCITSRAARSLSVSRRASSKTAS